VGVGWEELFGKGEATEKEDEGGEEYGAEEGEDGEEEEAEDDDAWDAALRGKQVPARTRAFVNKGTSPDVSGRLAFPIFAATSSHRTDCL
jgi:hypothetical protein